MQACAIAKFSSTASAGAEAMASDASALQGVDFAAVLAAQFQGNEGVVSLAAEFDSGERVSLQANDTVPDVKAEFDPALQAAALMPVFSPIVPAIQDVVPDVKPAFSAISPNHSLGGQKVSVLLTQADVGVGGAVMQATQQFAPELEQTFLHSSNKLWQDKTVSALSAPTGAEVMPAFPVMHAMRQALPEVKPVLSGFSPDNLSGNQDFIALSVSTDVKTLSPTKEGAAEFAANGKLLPPSDVMSNDVKATDISQLPVLPANTDHMHDVMASGPVVMTSANQLQAAGEIKPPVVDVRLPVGASGWNDAVGQRVVWMAGQHQQVAELHLNPPHLGPMEVRLTISNDQVSALFVSHQPAVRDAIEAAMPRLREMFADSGMMLGNAMVSSDSLPQHQNSRQEKHAEVESHAEFPLADGYAIPVTSRGIMSLHGDGSGMVDLFA